MSGVVESLRVLRYTPARPESYSALVDFEWREANGDQCGVRFTVPVDGLGIGCFKATSWGVLSLTDYAGLRAELSVDGRVFELPILDGDALEAGTRS